MKLSILTLSIILCGILPQQSVSLECGIKGITEPCIGDTDIRYNPDINYDLQDQDDFWNQWEGLYIQDQCNYNADGTPQSEFYYVPKEFGLGSWDACSNKNFLNVTFDGSRYYWQKYIVTKHNGDGPEGLQLPGSVYPIDYFGTSTYEKNAQIEELGSSVGYYEDNIFTVSTENLSTVTPIGGKSFTVMLEGSAGDLSAPQLYETNFCTDSECNKMNMYGEYYKAAVDGVSDVDFYARISSTKVDKETWLEEMGKVFVEYNIPHPDAPFTAIQGLDTGIFVQPFDPTTSDSAPKCHTLRCPTEKDWKVKDPYFGTSPYIEPNGVLTGGFIAGVTIASIVVAVLIFYAIYKRGVEKREQRVKEAVLKSIAKTMTLTTSRNLKANDLEKMFTKIDVDGNGNLDKSEVKGLVEEAGVANMSDRDYDILFSSIDLDGNGTLDFTEFCAFFASISISESEEGEPISESGKDRLEYA